MTNPPRRPRQTHLTASLCLALSAALFMALTAPAQAAPGPRHAKAAKHTKAAPEPAYGASADVLAFAADVAQRRQLPREWIAMQLGQARRIEAVRKLVMPPPAGTAKNWAAYRARFIEPRRIQAGLTFWRGNEAWLQQAETRWGVPPEIVVAIVGVETFYGRVTGNFRTLDALATLAFSFPPDRKDRSAYFRSELEEFFVLCAREGSNPQTVKGSYAGALGLPQFMPSSLNRMAVDLDGDGHIDLQNSGADVVGSVANYLASFGWQRGVATHFGVSVPADAADLAVLLANDILPSFSAAQFSERGAVLDEAGRAYPGPLALVALQNGDGAPSHVAGTENFYAITRYNWSSYYALAVIELAQAMVRQRADAAR